MRSRTQLGGYVLFLAPAFLLFTTLYMYPVFTGFIYAFTDWNGFTNYYHWIGLNNFRELFQDEQFLQAVWNTVYITIFSMNAILIAFVLSLVSDRGVKSMKLLRAIYFFPNIISAVIVAYIWSFILSPIQGPMNKILNAWFHFPIDHPWLMDKYSAKWSVILVNSWVAVGFFMVIFLAALQNIPKELYEAAEIDGVTYFQKIRHIVIPLILDTTRMIILLSIMGGLQIFDLVFALTKGGPFGETETIMTLLIKVTTIHE